MGDVEGGGGDDHLEVMAADQDALEDAEEKIHVEGTFVGLVDDDHVVGPEQRIGTGLGEQHAVGHELDARAVRHAPPVAVLEPDESAHLDAEFGGDALGHRHCRETARLRDGDAPQRARVEREGALAAMEELERHLR